jgi:hypothetical protein
MRTLYDTCPLQSLEKYVRKQFPVNSEQAQSGGDESFQKSPCVPDARNLVAFAIRRQNLPVSPRSLYGEIPAW